MLLLAKPVIRVLFFFFFFFPPHNKWFKFSTSDSLGAGLRGLFIYFSHLGSILDDMEQEKKRDFSKEKSAH